MNEIKHTRHIPKDIQLTGIRHAKEAICDLLNEQAESIAERARLRQVNAELVAALEDAAFLLAQIGKFPGDLPQFMDSIIRSVQDASAVLDKARE